MYVVINNIKWKIKFKPASSGELRRNNGSYTIGMTDNKTKTIYLSNDLHGSLLYNVLCHEMVHAFCFSYSIYFEVEEEERLADFIATYGRMLFNKTDEIIGMLIEENIA